MQLLELQGVGALDTLSLGMDAPFTNVADLRQGI
jgi:hypothetical protein